MWTAPLAIVMHNCISNGYGLQQASCITANLHVREHHQMHSTVMHTDFSRLVVQYGFLLATQGTLLDTACNLSTETAAGCFSLSGNVLVIDRICWHRTLVFGSHPEESSKQKALCEVTRK